MPTMTSRKYTQNKIDAGKCTCEGCCAYFPERIALEAKRKQQLRKDAKFIDKMAGEIRDGD